MLGGLIRKEWLYYRRSVRFRVAAATALGLTLLATWIAVEDYRLREQNFLAQQDQARNELGEVTVYSFLQPLALRPPPPLSVLDLGYEMRRGHEVRTNLFTIPSEAVGGESGSALLSGLPELDLTAVVRGVLGLLALLLMADTLALERRSGSLRWLLASGMSGRTLLRGKILGGLVTLAVPLSLCFTAAVTILVVRGGAQLGVAEVQRLLALFLAYSLYLTLMLLLGLAVSLWAPSASASVALAVFAWLAIVWVVPRTAAAVAEDVFGAGALAREVAEQRRDLLTQRGRELHELLIAEPFRVQLSGHYAPVLETGPNRGVLRRQGSDRYYASLADYYRQEVELGLAYAERQYALERRYQERLRAGSSMATIFAAPSPAFLLDRLAQALAGTSIEDQDRFLAAVRDYRGRVLAYVQENNGFGSRRWFTDDPPGQPSWTAHFGIAPEQVPLDEVSSFYDRLRQGEVATQRAALLERYAQDPARRLDLTRFPSFALSPVSLGAALGQAGAEIVVLLLWVLGAWQLISTRFRTLTRGRSNG